MYKIIFLSLMFALSYAKDLGAATPWDPRPRVGDGKSENAADDQLPSDKAAENNEINTDHDHTKEDAE